MNLGPFLSMNEHIGHIYTISNCWRLLSTIYVYIYCWKSPNSSPLYDHGFMDVIATTIVRQSKIDFIHKQAIRPLLHGGSHFVIAIICACVCWVLFVVASINIVHLIYIYIYIYFPGMRMVHYVHVQNGNPFTIVLLCPLLFCIFSCDQAALQMVFSVCPSVRLSVCLSVCHTFLTMFPSSYHHEIFRSYYQWPK